MKNILLLLLLPLSVFSKGSPKMTKYDVGKSGIKIYLPATPDSVTTEFSPDSSMVYTIECVDSSKETLIHFGAIVVDLNKATGVANEELTITYLDYLKKSLSVISSAGYGTGHTLSTHHSAKGIIDFWKDETEDEWQIVAWYAESFIVVQFAYGEKGLDNPSQWEVFKNGIRFPGDK